MNKIKVKSIFEIKVLDLDIEEEDKKYFQYYDFQKAMEKIFTSQAFCFVMAAEKVEFVTDFSDCIFKLNIIDSVCSKASNEEYFLKYLNSMDFSKILDEVKQKDKESKKKAKRKQKDKEYEESMFMLEKREKDMNQHIKENICIRWSIPEEDLDQETKDSTNWLDVKLHDSPVYIELKSCVGEWVETVDEISNKIDLPTWGNVLSYINKFYFLYNLKGYGVDHIFLESISKTIKDNETYLICSFGS